MIHKSKKINLLLLLIAIVSGLVMGCQNKKTVSEAEIIEATPTVTSENVGKGLEEVAIAYREVLQNLSEYEFNPAINPNVSGEYSYDLGYMNGMEVPQLIVRQHTDEGAYDVLIFDYNPTTLKAEQVKLNEYRNTFLIGVRPGSQTILMWRKDGDGLTYLWCHSNWESAAEFQERIKDGVIVEKQIWERTKPEFSVESELIPVDWTSAKDFSKIDVLAKEGFKQPEVKKENQFRTYEDWERLLGEWLWKDLSEEKLEAKGDDGGQEVLDETVFEGEILDLGFYDVLDLQQINDPNGNGDDGLRYIIFVLNQPTVVTCKSGGGNGEITRSATMIHLFNMTPEEASKYIGKKIKMKIVTEEGYWPSDTSLPLGEPRCGNYQIIE